MIADWGHHDYGCDDNSDKVKSFNVSNPLDPCDGNDYTYWDIDDQIWKKKSVDWKWFACNHTKTCIHMDNVCNLHPHPDCVYERDGLMISEDEENCSFRDFFVL